MERRSTVQLGEICQRLDVREREARYVLERGYVPAGVEKTPDSGNYRRFGPGQAFWLAMLLKLKDVGLKTSLAAEIATRAERLLRGVSQNLNWDWPFQPMRGGFHTAHRYYLDVGDARYIRLVTDANPSGGGRLDALEWQNLGHSAQRVPDVRPCAIIRLDLTQIASLLSDAFADPGPA